MAAPNDPRRTADGRPLDPRDRITPRDLERIRASVDAAPRFTPGQIAELRLIVHTDAAPARADENAA